MYGHKWWLCWKTSVQCGRELNFLHSDITVIILHGQILILYNWRAYLSITPRTSIKVKGKLHPISCHEGPEGEKRYSSTSILSLTSALDGRGWSSPRPGLFTSGKKDPLLIVQEASWTPGPVWTGAENLASHRDSIRGLSSPQRDVTPTTPSRCTQWRLYRQEIKPGITRETCSVKVKTFRWVDDVVLDESRNFDILVDGKNL